MGKEGLREYVIPVVERKVMARGAEAGDEVIFEGMVRRQSVLVGGSASLKFVRVCWPLLAIAMGEGLEGVSLPAVVTWSCVMSLSIVVGGCQRVAIQRALA